MEHLARARHQLPAAGARPRRRGAAHALRAGRPRSSPSCHGVWPRRVAAGALRAARRGAGGAAPGRRRLRADAGPTRSRSAGWRPLLDALPGTARDEVAAGPGRELEAELAAILARHWPARPAGGRDPCRPVPRQRLLPAATRLSGPDRLLFRLQRPASPTTSRSASTPGASRPTVASTSPRRRRCSRAITRCGRSTPAERAALPVLCRGAALRFLLTRLYDWLNTPPARW